MGRDGSRPRRACALLALLIVLVVGALLPGAPAGAAAREEAPPPDAPGTTLSVTADPAPADPPGTAGSSATAGGVDATESACAATIAPGQVLGCSADGNGETDNFTFTASAFDRVLLSYSGASSANLVVRTAADVELCNTSIGGGGLLTCPVQAAGTYKLAVTSNQSGPYDLGMQANTAASGCAPLAASFAGAPAAASLDVPAEIDCFTLAAGAGTTAWLYGGVPSGSGTYTVLNAAGVTMCNFTGSFAGESCALTGAAPFRLFVAGGGTGPYTMQMPQLTTPAGCTAIPNTAFGADPGTTGALDTVAEVDCYTFAAPAFAVEYIEVTRTGGSASPAWRMFDSTGATVCNSYWTDEQVTRCALGGAGTYTLLVGNDEPVPGYAVGVHQATAPTGCATTASLAFDAAPAEGAIAGAAEIDCQQFTAVAGDDLRVMLSSPTPNVTVSGWVVNNAGTEVCSFGEGVTACTLTGTGPYRALVASDRELAADWSLRLNKVNAPTGCTTTTLDAVDTAPGTDGSIDVAGEADCYTFSATAFNVDLVRVVITAGDLSPYWEIYASNGDQKCTASSVDATLCSLGGAGTYALVVSAYPWSNAQTGTYAVGLWNAKVATGCTAVASLAFGVAPHQAEIATAGETDCHSFSGVASDRVRLQVRSTTPSVAMHGMVVNAAGEQLCTLNDTSFTDCTLTGSGPYKAFTWADADGTAAYELQVQRLSNATGCTALTASAFGAAPAVDGTIDRAWEQDCYTFTGGTFGGRELFRVPATAGLDGVSWELFAKNGQQICTGSYDDPSTCALPANGTYTLVVSAWNDKVGTYRAGWWEVRLPGECTDMGPLAFGEAPTLGSIGASGEVDCFRFAAAASDVFRNRLTSLAAGADFHAIVVDGAGEQLCSFSVGQSSCTMTGTGPFRVLVFAVGADTGNYELRGWQLNNPGGCSPVASAAFGFGPVEQELSTDREADCFQFAGAVGDEFDVSIANLDIPSDIPYLELLDPAGNVLCANYGGTIDGCVLTETGPHALVVGSPYYDNTLGRYRIQGTCVNPACGTEEYAIGGLRPTSAGVGESVTVDLRGRVLSLDDTVQLERAGSAPIVGKSVLVSADRRALSVTFDLTGAAVGLWNVKVTSVTGAVVEIPNGFAVVNATPPNVDVQLVGRDRFVPNRPQTLSITYQNTGNVDALGVPVIVEGLPLGTVITPKFTMDHYDPVLHTFTPLVWDQAKNVVQANGALNLFLLLGRVPGGGKGQMDFTITIPTQTNYTLRVLAGACWNDPSASPNAVVLDATVTIDASVSGCMSAMVGAASNFLPGGPCVGVATGIATTVVQGAITGETPYSNMSAVDVMSTGLGAAACVASVIPGGQVVAGVLGGLGSLIGAASSGWSLGEGCVPDGSELPQNWVASMDPNEIAGPAGGGEAHAVRGDETFRYAIYFENKADASAPAQEVRVVDQLDPTVFDLSTLRFGSFQWGTNVWTPSEGSTEVDQVLDLRPDQNLKVHLKASVDETGKASWELLSLDPSTDALPEDPDMGFLPPNVDGTEGQGVVFFEVDLLHPQNHDVVTNKADITFDLNPVIVTNTWSNLIDTDLPTSEVADLPASTSGTDIPVTWSGTDATSGVATYDVFVSTDGGAYEPWKVATTDTSGTYQGVTSHTYAFSSTARDFAGNEELLPPSPDATTTIGVAAGVPGAPTAVSATAGDELATVFWTAPASNGGSPITGYTIVSSPGAVSVTVGASATQAQVTGLNNGTAYTFTVRAKNAVGDSAPSAASNSVTPTGQPACNASAFTDVNADNQFCGDITWMVGQGITTGYQDGTFKPEAAITRQAMAAFLYRLSGSPLGAKPLCSTDSPFSDVKKTHAFCGEIQWMVSEGITGGYSDGTFKPGAPVSRQAMAAFMYRLAGKPLGENPPCPQAPFKDVPTSSTFCGAIKWMVGANISNGYADGTFRPANPVSRQAMAAFLHRFKNLP